MKKTERNLLVLTSITLVLLFLLSSTNLVLGEKKNDVYLISILVEDASTKSWDNFRMGMDKAAEKWNVDVSFVTLYDQADAAQQAQLLQREAENGAEALILSPTDCVAMEKAVNAIPQGLPVIAVGAGVNSQRVRSVIAAEPGVLGAALGAKIGTAHKTNPYTQVIEVTYQQNRTDLTDFSDSMFRALPDFLPVHRVTVASEQEITTLLQQLTDEKTPSAIVGLDAAATLALAEILAPMKPAEEKSNLTLYGVGWSSSLQRYLDNGTMAAVGVYNDYDRGYLSMETAVKFLRGEQIETRYTVGQALIAAGDVHSKEYEMLLFPIG